MQVTTDLKQFLTKKPSAVTVGNFDGVHLGHQALFANLKSLAQQKNLEPWVVTFDPQPLEFFNRRVPARLTNFPEKLQLLESYGVENVLCIDFNNEWAQMTAESFVEDFLKGQVQCETMIVGHDFKFGHNRTGGIDLLKSHGIEVVDVPAVTSGDERISSSLIRRALAQGDFERAKQFLNRNYAMRGEVIHGDKRGREWGFPTANIALSRQVSPLHGIYSVKVHGLSEGVLRAVASIGTRPVVDGKHWLLEVFIFDFDRDIYGETLHVEFCHKLRDEQSFNTIDLLKKQIALDVEHAKDYFNDERLQANT